VNHAATSFATVKLLAASTLCLVSLLAAPLAASATTPPDDPNGESAPVDTSTFVTEATVAPAALPESGAAVPAPAAGASAPLVAIPNGCPTPPVVSVVFVGTLVAKATDIARYRVEQIRAGSADSYMVGGLVDIHYDNETQYLDMEEQYLVGAVPLGADLVLSSKVRESHPLFGGNAVIGLTEKNLECPRVEDPVRTLHTDGSAIDNGVLKGLAHDRKGIVLAFAIPIAVAFAIVLALVLVRWLFTLIFVAARHAADGEPVPPFPRKRRHHAG